ncbi:MAG: small ribosomal subunit biogenesis GTPase RsgA [Gammaproteobacteria bacterium]
MAPKRRLTKRQKARIRSIQHKRAKRAIAHSHAAESVPEQRLGPEQPGLVISHHGATVMVEGAAGALWRCSVRRNLGSLVCGDRVAWQPADEREGVVVALLPRHSLLLRPQPGGRGKPVAANIEQIVVVAAVEPELSEHLIDRYLVTAETTGIAPVIVVNKVELLDAGGRRDLERRLATYRQLGYPVLLVSVKADHGLDPLLAQLQGHTSILVGQSGVGKSSLVKALLPEREIRVAALSEARHGRHTTTTTVLYHLPCGGDLIDSPGVRDFGVWHIATDDVAHGFVEFRPLLGHCKFSDCSHRHEPGCALRQAAEAGRIDPQRLQSYLNMMEEIRLNPRP